MEMITITTMANRSLNRLILGILFLCVIAYTVFVFRFYLQKPNIELDQRDYIVTNNSVITLSGVTDNVHTLHINGVSVFVDAEGRFSQTRSITNGVTHITLIATDRFEREIERSISVEKQEVFVPPPPTEEELEVLEEEIEKLTD